MKFRLFAYGALAALIGGTAFADEIGSVDTTFKLIGANHKIVVEAFDDPKVKGVTCFLSMARKGGISGSLGLAEETSDASIACRQVGPIEFVEAISSDDEGRTSFQSAAIGAVQEATSGAVPRPPTEFPCLPRVQRQADRRVS